MAPDQETWLTKHIVPLGWVFLANPHGDSPKYPTLVHWALFCLRVRSLEPGTSPILSCIHPFIPFRQWHHTQLPSHWNITPTSPYDALMMSCSFLWEPTCKHPNIWAEIPCSKCVCLCIHAQTTPTLSEILTPGTQCDTLPWVPWHALTLILQS